MLNFSRDQRIFLFRGLLIIFIYMVIQYTPLFDFFNSKLTELISHSSRGVLFNLFNEFKIFDYWNGKRWVMSNGDQSLHIGSVCNGYGLIFMYVGFIISTAGIVISRKLFFIFIGSVSIFGFNVLRIVLLFILKNNYPDLFELFHHYIFQIAVYLMIFAFWYYFLKSDFGLQEDLNVNVG